MAEVNATQPTARELIEMALETLGVLDPHRSATSVQAQRGLRRLNNMVESWNASGRMIYTHERVSFVLTASHNPHTVGKSINGSGAGDFDIVRPLKIDSASILRSGDENEYPVTPLSKEQYQDIPLKSTQSDYPAYLWYEKTFPLGNIHLYPQPQSALTIILYVWRQIDSGMALTDRFALPPGYLRALEYNLAVEIASAFGKVPSKTVENIAKESKATIAKLNTSERSFVEPDASLLLLGNQGGVYNIASDQYE